MRPAPQPFLPLETRREAREAILPELTDRQVEVLHAIAVAGEAGRTVHELVEVTDRLTNSCGPRITELRKAGRIVACGRRAAPGHRAATAWRIA